MRQQYPLMIDLSGRSCLVVGGGEVAERKVLSLMQAGADVTVLSPELSPGLHALWQEQRKFRWIAEEFRQQQVAGYTLVIAATNRAEVNLAVYRAVKLTDGWINIVDRPDLCNFIVPSVIQRGKLMVAVSTSGASPSLAKKLKTELERLIGPEYEEYLDFLAETRQQVLAQVDDAKVRKRIFQQLLDDAYLFASGEERKNMAASLIGEWSREGGQGGKHENVESRNPPQHAGVNTDRMGH
ncbi:precorrin-2 dehydrogenase/sirohydrochlorin ferrochelatase family protein [Brevibacillus fulvus]|uniref:precorrin-2 dehydrogenase n=1 Tax=Brevibacillus fulvus TaxID=1125967 RepID=A0A938Y1T8_9BACL|nr:bifunctional precorrin-2 dehydrogenase/sirohydrochlorin ferrochelatase [Brevibacillus fulvus]MBM7590052.1 precorrin-2 dehydrogenase/sirohydrochlorin ferrochelatase [Brevibacillus fulvus]